MRFLALVTVGWIGTRLVLLWPQLDSLPAAIQVLAPFALPPAQASRAPPLPRVAGPLRPMPVRLPMLAAAPVIAPAPPAMIRPIVPPSPVPARALPPRSPIVAAQSLPSVLAPGLGPERLDHPASRWSASTWLSVRPGTGIGAAPGGGQIGGSQVGARLVYLLAPKARVAAFARLAGPLHGKGREAAVGLEWQPTPAPVRIVAERRFGLDGTRVGAGLGVIAGYDGSAAGFHLESYGQAGAVWRARAEPYADGAVRITRPLASAGHLRAAFGLGGWGAAQRDAQRLDIGPSATLAVPLGQASLRMALDWRQRVAGSARPGSGPALTLGADF